MHPYRSATLCAAVLALASPARAHDVPQPVSRTVLVPPAEPAQFASDPAANPTPVPPEPEYTLAPTFAGVPARGPVYVPAPAPRVARSELGVQLRMGAVETDQFLLGTSIAGSSGPVTIGFSADAMADVGSGTGRHYADGGGHWWGNWCVERPDGRCVSRADLAVAGFAGLRTPTDPVHGPRLRLELVGELGWQWTRVNERVTGSGGAEWSEASRAFTFGGVRGAIGLRVARYASFGFGAFARQGLREKVCVSTGGGCTWAGGRTTGVYGFLGADWGVGG